MQSPLPARLAEARRLLRHHFGHQDFRPAQRRVVQSVLAGRDTLAVLPTGGGKSLCFQIPALVLDRLAVVVSPLISLMHDQVHALRARGIPAAYLNSALPPDERESVLRDLHAGALRLLYVAPERLERLAGELAERGPRPALLAVDEAHCIAEWGHDFRPSYRRLRRARALLGDPPVVALTGSATPEVRADIARSLGLRRPDVHLGSFDRPNLWFGVVRVPDERRRLEALLRLLGSGDRIAIVYAPTRGLTEAVARRLREHGLRAAPYHAGLRKEARAATLEAFLGDQLEAVVATCAFGMGIDKPDVRLVVHWGTPPTPESYYQEAGRAGRDGAPARCVLLYRPGDAAMHRRQLEVTFPPRRLCERVWSGEVDPRTVPPNVLLSIERLRRELRPDRGAVGWRAVEERRRAAGARIRAMERYAERRGCRRAALIGYFGERLESCVGCDGCGPGRDVVPLQGRARERLARLRRALAPVRAPWGGCVLDPGALRRLAERPPRSAGELADVEGVGPCVAERWGARIFQALGVAPAGGPGAIREAADEADVLAAHLRAWRSEAARAAGLPEYLVLTDGTLGRLAEARPRDRGALARVRGVGPRALATWGERILRIVEAHAGCGVAPPEAP